MLDVGGASGAFALQVLDAQGLYYGDGCVEVDGATMSTAASLGAPGEYSVRWQLVAADGHTVSGEFPFAWSPTAASVPSAGSATPPVCGVAAEPLSPSGAASPVPSAPEATPGPSSEPAAQSDSLPVVLAIGGGVLALATVVIAAVLLVGRRRGA